MSARRARSVLLRQALIAGVSGAILSGVIVALTWGLLSGEAFGARHYEQSPEALYQARLRKAAVNSARQDGWLDGRRMATAELEELVDSGSFDAGWEIGHDYSWNRMIDLALEQSSRQSYASEPGTQWIELRR